MSNQVPWLYIKCYRTGYRWCSRCQVYRKGRTDKTHLCEDCNTKLRSRGKGNVSRRLRDENGEVWRAD